jgi:integrase
MLRTAEEDGLVAPGIFPRLTWPEHEIPEPDPFEADERARIIEWFRTKRFGLPQEKGSMVKPFRVHPHFYAYVHTLFWTGMRPSEASGLQWRDVDLDGTRLFVRRSYHLGAYGAPKTKRARRTVVLYAQTVEILRSIQPLRIEPETAVFKTTTGTPIEPKTFSSHWYDCLRVVGIRVRGLYCTKDTYVSAALKAGVRIERLEEQTGVAYATLRKHYAKWLHDDERDDELRVLAEATDPSLLKAEIVPARGELLLPPHGTKGLSKCEEGDLNPHGCYPTSPSN